MSFTTVTTLLSSFLVAAALTGQEAAIPAPATDKIVVLEDGGLYMPIEEEKIQVGKPAFEVTGFDGHNQPAKVTDFKGQVTILCLSTLWCMPCKQMAPKFNAMYEADLKGKGVKCLTLLAGGATQKDAALWTEKFKMTMPVLMDEKGAKGPVVKYWRGCKGVPSYIVIDKEFVVRQITAGSFEEAKKLSLELIAK